MRAKIKSISILFVLTLACVIAGIVSLFIPSFSNKKTMVSAAANELITVSSTGSYEVFNSGGYNNDYSYPTHAWDNPALGTLTNNGKPMFFLDSSSYDSEGALGLPFIIDGTMQERSSVTIYAFDIDDGSQRDVIYLKDLTAGTKTRLGILTGRNETWSTTTLYIDANNFQDGHQYQFYIDLEISGWYLWITNINFNAGKITGGITPPPVVVQPVQDAYLNASISASGTISATLDFVPANTQTFALEFTATHIDTADQRGSTSATVTGTPNGVSKSVSFALDSGSPKGTYQIAALIKESNGNVLKTVTCTVGYAYSAVNYDPNGGSNNCPIDSKAYSSGNTVTVKFDYIPSRDGYTFLGWSRNASATTPEFTQNGTKSFTISSSNVTLYAVWEKSQTPVTPPNDSVDLEFDIWDGSIANGFGGGDGSQNNPYLIKTCAQLAYLAQTTNNGTTYSGKYFKLVKNLDLNNRAWTPIGIGDSDENDFSTKTFCGTFNGNEKIICNVSVNLTNNNQGGLFGVLYNAKIYQLLITNANVTVSGSHVVSSGIICGRMKNTTVEQCAVSGTSSAIENSYDSPHCAQPGLIAGGGVAVKILDCMAIGEVYGKSTNAWNVYAGGLIGRVHNGTSEIKNSYFGGYVEAKANNYGYAGGLCGMNESRLDISNCFAIGTISSNTYANSIGCKWNTSGYPTVSNSYYYVDILSGSVQANYGTSTSLTNLSSPSWGKSHLNWDFTNTWIYASELGIDVDSLGGYDIPVLRFMGALNGNPNQPHTHNYVENSRVDATCTSNGYLIKKCSCGDEIYEPIPAFNHDWKETGRSEAVCMNGGYVDYKCSICHETKRERIPAPGHAWGPSATYVAPSCEEDGYWVVTCDVCEVVSRIVDENTALGHKFDDGIVLTPATCVTTGVARYTCTVCGYKEKRTIPTLEGHFMNWTVTKSESCTTDGARHGVCSACGFETEEVIKATGHTYVYTDNQDELTHTVTCEKCNYNEVEKHKSGLKTCVCGYKNDNFLSVLLIQDVRPWSSEANATILNTMQKEGYIDGWEQCTTAEFATLDASQYSMIVFANDQSTSTYSRYSTIKPQLEAYVQAGGSLLFGACWSGWSGGTLSDTLIGGVSTSLEYSYRNQVVDGDHDIITGVLTEGDTLTNDDLYHNYASHVYFTNLPANANVILNNTSGKATLVEYTYGQGNVVASGLTWEHAYIYHSYNTYYANKAMQDLFVYTLSQSDILPAERVYTVTYQDYDDTVLYVERVVIGQNATAEVTPTRDGYTFTGWDNPSALENVMENVTVKALYTLDQYEIVLVFDETMGTAHGAGSYTYGEYVALYAEANADQAFVGWFIGGTLVSENDTYVHQVEGTITIEARFGEYVAPNTPIVNIGSAVGKPGQTVTIDFIMQDNPGIIALQADVAYDSDVLELISITDRAILGSYCGSPTYENNPYRLFWENGNDTKDIFSNGVIVTMTFKIKDTANVGSTEISVRSDAAYNFNFNMVDFVFIPGYVKITNEYTVTFESNGGNAVDTQYVYHGSTAQEPSIPQKEGNIFLGWYADENLTMLWDFNTPIESNVTLYAGWEVIEYIVQFESNGGSYVPAQAIPYGMKAIQPENPTNGDSDFLGWYVDSELTTLWDFNAPVTDDLVLYAGWGSYGDIDGNGEINAIDLTILKRYLAKWEGYDDKVVLHACDLNGDGKVTMIDATILSRYFAKWEGYETLPKI